LHEVSIFSELRPLALIRLRYALADAALAFEHATRSGVLKVLLDV
jgi:hypothetical protein